MQNKDIIENAFKLLMALLMSLCLYILKDFGNSLDKMQSSVNSLNISFATMSERLINQAALNTTLEARVSALEDRLDQKTKDLWTKQDHMDFARDIKRRLDKLEDKK